MTEPRPAADDDQPVIREPEEPVSPADDDDRLYADPLDTDDPDDDDLDDDDIDIDDVAPVLDTEEDDG
jgi:hypothetical protein